MIGSGRCHGPGCHQGAVEGPWCSPDCREAWHAEFHWLYGDSRVEEPVIVREVEEDESSATLRLWRERTLENTPAPASPFLLAAVEEHMPAVQEAVAAEIDRVVAYTLTQARDHQIAHAAPGSMVEDISRACGIATPRLPGSVSYGDIVRLYELVDRVEDSTLYQQAREQQIRRRFREAARDMARVPPAKAAFPQVAPGEPLDTHSQVTDNKRRSERGEPGWWVRWLNRIRRGE